MAGSKEEVLVLDAHKGQEPGAPFHPSDQPGKTGWAKERGTKVN